MMSGSVQVKEEKEEEPTLQDASLRVLHKAEPIGKKPSLSMRFRTMAKTGIRMMFYDKLKLMGTLLGVVFAVVLSNQQGGTFMGLLYKNQMLIKNTTADLWLVPAGAETVQGGKVIPMSDILHARAVQGVEAAEPLLYATVPVSLPAGGNEPVSLVGTKYPNYLGGPWNIVVGNRDVLLRPDTMIFEDADRKVLGGLNIGSVREVGGRKITVGAFTWGLMPFGPSMAFADYELARELTHMPNDQATFGLVKVKEGVSVADVQREIKKQVGLTQVLTKSEFEKIIVNNVLTKTAIGVTLGSSAVMGVIVGFVIVALSMFSAVVDNIREFGTLKAIGATNFDLGLLLLVQSVIYACMGSILGLTLVRFVAMGVRSAKLALNLTPELTVGTLVVMNVICILASSLALLRLRKVEPAMVFR